MAFPYIVSRLSPWQQLVTLISDSWLFKQKAWPLYRKDFLQVKEKSGDMITKIGYKSALHSVQGNMPGMLMSRT